MSSTVYPSANNEQPLPYPLTYPSEIEPQPQGPLLPSSMKRTDACGRAPDLVRNALGIVFILPF